MTKKKKKDRSNTIVDNSDVLEGFVIKRFDNNDKYEGFYFNGKRCGKGTYIWSSGDKYIGEWALGVFNGVGTLTLRTGDHHHHHHHQDFIFSIVMIIGI